MFAVSRSVDFRRFGFLPRGRFVYDFYASIFGHPNLYKRLQARDLMSMLNLKPADVALDFGCGRGFFTVEMAKLGTMTYGIDVDPSVKNLKVPKELEGRLEFVMGDGRALPFENDKFDVVLASEVIAFIEDSDSFMQEIRRVLKPNGRLVICNGCGHPAIAKAYEMNSFGLRVLKMLVLNKVPPTYSDYCAKLNATFGNEQRSFLQQNDVEQLVAKNGLRRESVLWSPSIAFGSYYSWLQFVKYCITGDPLLRMGFLLHYMVFSVVQRWHLTGYRGGLILTAVKET